MRGDRWAYASGGAYPRLSFLDGLALGALRLRFPGEVKLKASTSHFISSFRTAATLEERREVGSSELATAESSCG